MALGLSLANVRHKLIHHVFDLPLCPLTQHKKLKADRRVRTICFHLAPHPKRKVLNSERQFHQHVHGQVLWLAQYHPASPRTQIHNRSWNQPLTFCELNGSRTYASKTRVATLLLETDLRVRCG